MRWCGGGAGRVNIVRVGVEAAQAGRVKIVSVEESRIESALWELVWSRG